LGATFARASLLPPPASVHSLGSDFVQVFLEHMNRRITTSVVCGTCRSNPHIIKSLKRLERRVSAEAIASRKLIRRERQARLRMEALLDLIAREVARLVERLP